MINASHLPGEYDRYPFHRELIAALPARCAEN